MILHKAAAGLSEQEIASELTLTKQEVSNSKKNILKKLSASNPLQGIQNLAKAGFHVTD
jgi:DNA-binding NarL/FixJ family response regulator